MSQEMHSELQLTLERYRDQRSFDPEQYLKAKSSLLNAYFRKTNIQGCVLGLSGGVDSALVLAILTHASKQPGSPIIKVSPTLLPIHTEGATSQNEALARGKEVGSAFQNPPVTIDLSSCLTEARRASLAGTGFSGNAWSAGQLASYIRTPMLYYQAALLNESGIRSVVCGTTNRDEGSYIGFFGKASDGMVDIQPISDVHKSEVYRLARILDVPKSVLGIKPSGDTYDGRNDEEMIGASYDVVELLTWYLCLGQEDRQVWRKSLCSEAEAQFGEFEVQIEKLHRINRHKYIGDSPAVHLDIYDRTVPDGWRLQCQRSELKQSSAKKASAARIGPIELPQQCKPCPKAKSKASVTDSTISPIADCGESAVLVRGVLNKDECTDLLYGIQSAPWVSANKHGKPVTDLGEGHPGSYRATAFDEEIACALWSRISHALPSVRTFDEFASTDWGGHPVWRPIGVNPMLRFIRYESGGAILPHYDAGYDYNDGHRHTLMSVIFTLTPSTAASGGRTRVLVDPQRYLPYDEREFADDNHTALPREVLATIDANQGDAFVFDHRIRHDVSPWNEEYSRVILRTDIIFEKCSPHALRDWPNLKQEFPQADLGNRRMGANYRKAFQALDDQELVKEAGFLDEIFHKDMQWDPRWLTCSYDKIVRNIALSRTSSELIVLVATGGFFPIHSGHLEMMESAKLELESRGKVVIGGILAPDHDNYIRTKCGGLSIPAFERLDLCDRMLTESNWLTVDRWAALYAADTVNFTTILDRIQSALNFNIVLHRPIHVAYVFGSDNARFAAAFADRGLCVSIPRPGYESRQVVIAEKLGYRRGIMYSGYETRSLSSSQIRQGRLLGLPAAIKDRWLHLNDVWGHPGTKENSPSVLFSMRFEESWAVTPWTTLPFASSTTIEKAYATFCQSLRHEFDLLFRRRSEAGQGSPVEIETIYLENQRAKFDQKFKNKHITSLDPCLPSPTNLLVSRCFTPVAGEFRNFVARPGAESIEKQVASIPSEPTTLLDDDTVTGQTFTYAKSLLRHRCNVEDFVTFSSQIDTECKTRLDLVDCRDFLAGAREAGLVLSLDDSKLCRAPYVLPYVSPHRRASVPCTEEIAFSRSIWHLNKIFFTSTGIALCVSDMSKPYQVLCAHRGFRPSCTMEEVCEWHIKQLSAAASGTQED